MNNDDMDLPDFLRRNPVKNEEKKQMEIEKSEKIVQLDSEIAKIDDKVKLLQQERGKRMRERRAEMSRIVSKALKEAK